MLAVASSVNTLEKLEKRDTNCEQPQGALHCSPCGLQCSASSARTANHIFAVNGKPVSKTVKPGRGLTT